MAYLTLHFAKIASSIRKFNQHLCLDKVGLRRGDCYATTATLLWDSAWLAVQNKSYYCESIENVDLSKRESYEGTERTYYQSFHRSAI